MSTLDLGREPPPGELLAIYLEVLVADRQGHLVGHTLEPARSWVRQAPHLFRNVMTRLQENNVRDTGNVLRNLRAGAATEKMDPTGGAGDTTRGLLVGTGTAAATREDFALATLVPHGTGAGQLSYGNQFGANIIQAQVAGGYRVTVSRQFVNDSPGNITITEAGLAVQARDDANVLRFFLMLRDLINGGAGHLTPNGGGSATLRYHFDSLA